MDAAWAPGQSRGSPLKPSLPSCIQFPGWTTPLGRPEPGLAFIKAGAAPGRGGRKQELRGQGPLWVPQRRMPEADLFWSPHPPPHGLQPGSATGGGQRLRPARPAQRLQGCFCSKPTFLAVTEGKGVLLPASPFLSPIARGKGHRSLADTASFFEMFLYWLNK